MKVAALVPAAGQGERMARALRLLEGERDRPPLAGKLFLELDGRPILRWTLEGLLASHAVEGAWVAAAPAWEAQVRAEVERWGLRNVRVLAGGATRQASVWRLMEALPGEVEWVVVHDGARPLVDPTLVDRVLAAALRDGAAVCALPVHETVKRVGASGLVEGTVEREGLWTIQTPQAFRRTLLAEAHQAAERAGVVATDDAALVERLGHPVRAVPGSPRNVKITTPEDLDAAGRWLRPGGTLVPESGIVPAAGIRTGLGLDLHRFGPGRRLVLGGVTIPWEMGLVGHSDGDALAHAVADALLGAAGMGDLGGRFPDDDPAYENADSLLLLRRVAEEVAAAGFRALSVDATLLAEAPKLAPHLAQMGRNLREAMGGEGAAVNVKATRPEGLGALGRAEGIAAFCVVTCVRA
ncbi:2-C-methyl-D-erythritol 4-phosphate cytidylyltransferase [Limnochorda pilosa]|uniref:Bifunctional enzyme IspD/IspF n=1 Tax=Limnochorda pilosa TaxID=1555112 RepID=A0A0K2SPU1_LIMPI|nr:2-C-methyl-D-erythritol 4-phosphate cytidylyltransferase [Limnochorda pilosa]BAS29116.1 2-C-methyl-D-erythritol 2,4-cyclodiphosphate synthase [Limnochorda pilosa]